MTDGESGITGVSIDRIFEFPKEERRRTKRVKRISISSEGNCPDPEDGRDPGTLACSNWGNYHGSPFNVDSAGLAWSRREAIATYDSRNSGAAWNARLANRALGAILAGAGRGRGGRCLPGSGARYVAGSADFGPGHNIKGYHGNDRGDGLGWFYDRNEANLGIYIHRARESRAWTATCKKTVRRTRR